MGIDAGIVWQACTVKWKREDAPALTAWVGEDNDGIGLLVYTTPALPILTERGIRTCSPLFRYIVSGHMHGFAASVEKAQHDALACARAAPTELSTSRHRTRRDWFHAIVAVTVNQPPAST